MMVNDACTSLLTIKAEPLSIDLDTCRFTVNQRVHPGGPFFYKSEEAAAGSPLPERLFQIEGVAHVLIADNVVTVGKTADRSWSDLMRPIGQAIRTLLQSGVPVLIEKGATRRSGPRSDAQIREDVEALVDDEINPGVAKHGGRISVVEVKDAVVYLAMSGGCQGCAAASVTLKHGVEVMLRQQIPEIVEIRDTTNHAAGSNPFYQASK